jgi:phosphoglycolate phosphatase
MHNKTVVFDLDGTLVDSASIVSEILNSMRKELSLSPVPAEMFLPWISLGGDVLVSRALEMQVNYVGPYTKIFRERYFDLPTPLESIYPGVFEALEFLSSNDVTINLCTNKPRRLAEKVLAETSLHSFFSFVCAGGDLATAKPNPENLMICLRQSNVGLGGCYFVGDSSVDQITAENANVKFIFYKNGYDDGVDKDKTYAIFDDYFAFEKIFLV